MLQYLGYIFICFFIVYLASMGIYFMLKRDFGVEVPLQSQILWTRDSGENWIKVKNPTNEKLEIDNFAFDPQDADNIYVATVKGFFQTKGGEESYRKEEDLYYASAKEVFKKNIFERKNIFIQSEEKPISISEFIYDYENPNILYVVSEELGRNKLFKSLNGGKDFTILFVSQVDDKITAFLPSPYSRKILYIGTKKGIFLKSDDFGNSWRKTGEFSGEVKQIGIDPVSPGEVYVVTFPVYHPTAIPPSPSRIPGMVFKSEDFGESLKKIDLPYEIEEVVFDPLQSKAYFVSELSIFEMEGRKVKYLNLPSGQAKITAFTIDPKNSNILYLGQGEIFYRSTNRGEDWKIVKLQERGRIDEIKVNSDDTDKILIEVEKVF